MARCQNANVPANVSLQRVERGNAWFCTVAGRLCDGIAILEDTAPPILPRGLIKVCLDQARGRVEFIVNGMSMGVINCSRGANLRFCCFTDQGAWTITSGSESIKHIRPIPLKAQTPPDRIYERVSAPKPPLSSMPQERDKSNPETLAQASNLSKHPPSRADVTASSRDAVAQSWTGTQASNTRLEAAPVSVSKAGGSFTDPLVELFRQYNSAQDKPPPWVVSEPGGGVVAPPAPLPEADARNPASGGGGGGSRALKELAELEAVARNPSSGAATGWPRMDDAKVELVCDFFSDYGRDYASPADFAAPSPSGTVLLSESTCPPEGEVFVDCQPLDAGVSPEIKQLFCPCKYKRLITVPRRRNNIFSILSLNTGRADWEEVLLCDQCGKVHRLPRNQSVEVL